MFGLGMSEIIVLAVLALVVIGPKELPELARTIGRFMNELKRTTNVLSDELKEHARFDPMASQHNSKPFEPEPYTEHLALPHPDQSPAAEQEGEQLELVDQSNSEDKTEKQKPS